MKRAITIICAVLLLIYSAVPTFALEETSEPETIAAEQTAAPETSEPSTVVITVMMPEAPVPTPPPAPEVYPTHVSELRGIGERQIVKTYELSALERPEGIPRGAFERGGWRYTLMDITRSETTNAETRDHTEAVTVNTGTKTLEEILPLLATTVEYRSEDGFVGILSLDMASIKVETAGTRTTSYTMTVNREYPHLSANDTSLVPKTVQDGGTTFTLDDVSWQTQNTESVDYDTLPSSYTAAATYTATGTSTRVTGYVTTAEYTGTLVKLADGKTIYTAYFEGVEISSPIETITESVEPEATEAVEPTAPVEPTSEITEAPESTDTTDKSVLSRDKLLDPRVWLAIIPIACLAIGGIYFMAKKRRRD